MTKTFQCPECHQRLPDQAFRNQKNRREKVCQRCRRNAKARYKYQKKMRELDKRVANAAKRDMTGLLQESNARKLIREVRRIAAQDKHYARKYKEKIDNGTATAKTYTAHEQRQMRVGFYELVEQCILQDEQRGVFWPLNYYLTNTKLLARAGFPVRIRRGDPDLLEAQTGDTREESQERDRQDSQGT